MDRVALIGTGGFGSCWFPALRARRDRIQVVVIAEPDPTERARAAELFDVPAENVFDRLPSRLPDTGTTMAVDSSPFVHHRGHAEVVLGGGADLLMAKPMAGSLADAEAIVSCAAKTGRRVGVAQQMRYFPCFLALRDLLRERRFGAPRAVEVEMALDGRGWVPGTRWRLAMRHPLLLEAGIHHFDLLRWILDDEITGLALVAWNPPWSPFADAATVSATMRTSGGVPVVYRATFAPAADQSPVRFDSGWRIVCDDATLTVTDGGVYADGQLVGAAATAEPVSLEELNDTLLDVWFAARAAGKPAPFDATDNLRSMALVDSAIRCAENGGGPR